MENDIAPDLPSVDTEVTVLVPNESKDDNNTKSPKKVRFLRALYGSKIQTDKAELKSKRKRHKLALKIFNHISEQGKEYFSDKNNLFYPDEAKIFSSYQILDKKEPEEDSLAQTNKVFDHLELFRPYLNVINDFKVETKPKTFTGDSRSKIDKNEYENWMKHIMWSCSDLKGDYRNDLHTLKAGWIPSGNQRTWSQFLNNGLYNQEITSSRVLIYRSMNNSLININPNDPLNYDPSNWFSLFPKTQKHDPNEWLNRTILNYDDIFADIHKYEYSLDEQGEIDFYVDREIEKNERSEHNNRFIDNTEDLVFNVSADDYYLPSKTTKLHESEMFSIKIRHSLPALDLQRTLFPTYIDILHLRRLHRPLLIDFDHGPKLKTGFHTIYSLKHYNEENLKIYQEIIDASGSQEVFLMKSMLDLTPMNGHIILFEYSEEFPLFLSQVGMNSIIKIYYNKSKSAKDPDFGEYGDLVVLPHNMSPFLGNIHNGEFLLSIENNMFRAPLFRHDVKNTDFLIIRNTRGYFIRKIPVIFTVAQQHPKMEVPSPNSKVAMRTARERLQTFIIQMFMKSCENPKRLKIACIRRAFKQHSENSIRKRLKMCADYIRQTGLAGGRSNWWILKSDFRLPTYEDLHERLEPEAVCAYYSMLDAQRRLKDAGYGKKSLFMAEEENEDDEDDDGRVVDEEILCAPWHKTRAFLLAQKGKCLLQINGFADPTGCGEGFSYVRHTAKTLREDSIYKYDGHMKKKAGISGDSDLRKLKLYQCRQILAEADVTPDKIDQMSRWEMINVIRNLASTPKGGRIQELISKFGRVVRHHAIESLDKYREECQAIFDLQNRCLASKEEFSSDEEEDNPDENNDINELTKDLEMMLNQKKDPNFSYDEEEYCRLDLLKILNEPQNFDNDPDYPSQVEEHKITRLVINRTFSENERKFIRSEVVTDPRIISAYLRITKNPNYRQVYAKHDTKTIDELRKEKKRVQDQLRRIKKHEERESLMPTQENPETEIKREKPKLKMNVRCTACGEVGHMRTNKICAKYIERHNSPDKLSDDISNDDRRREKLNENIVKVEGTRLVVGKSLVEAADELYRKASKSKQKQELYGKKRRKSDEYMCDYLHKHYKNTTRRRADPNIILSAIFEEIILKLKDLPDTWLFHLPVDVKKVPDYYNIIKNPMDLLNLRDLCKAFKFDHRDKFIECISKIYENSVIYNGKDHQITQSALSLISSAKSLIEERIDEIKSLEIEINPLLSKDSQTKMSWIFENIINESRSLQFAQPFLYPVNVKLVRDYYNYITRPMDLESLKFNVTNDQYSSREQFFKDFDLIRSNCLAYNGPNHSYTKMANELHDHIYNLVEKNSELLSEFESQLSVKNTFTPISQDQERSSVSTLKNPMSQEPTQFSEEPEFADILDDLQCSEPGSPLNLKE